MNRLRKIPFWEKNENGYLYTNSNIVTGQSYDSITDGDTNIDNSYFANWYEAPTNWTNINASTDGTDISAVSRSIIKKEETNVDTGNYAVEIEGDANCDFNFILQEVTGLTTSDSYTLTAKARYKDSAGDIGVIFYNGNPMDGATQIYNFTTDTWDAVTGPPGADNIDSYALTDAYQTFTFESVSVPANENITPIIFESGSEVNIYVDEVELRKDGTGDDVITDGGFEIWGTPTDFSFVEDWNYLKEGGSDDSIEIETGSNKNYGLYGVKIDSGTSDLKAIASKVNSGLSGNYLVGFWEKDTDATDKFRVYLFDDELGSETKVYDWTNETWDNYSASTLPTGEATQYYEFDGQNDSGIRTTPAFEAPASGKIQMWVEYVAGSNTNICYVDDFGIYNATERTLFSFYNKTASGDLDINDHLISYYVDDGAGNYAKLLDVGVDGKWTTALSAFDFTDATVKVADGSSESEALNYGQFKSSETLLGSTTGIDCTSTGTTELYEVPTGKKAIITKIVTHCTTATATGGDGTYNIGTNATDYNNILGGLIGTTNQDYTNNENVGVASVPTAGDKIYFKVAGADSGTTLVWDIYIFGILIDA